MKRFLAILIATLFCLQGLAQRRGTLPSVNAYRVVKELHPATAVHFPKEHRDVKLRDFVISGSNVYFKLNRIRFHFEWVGSPDVAMRVNNVGFTPEEIKDQAKLRKAIIKKFKLKPRRVSLWNLIFGEAQAKSIFSPFLSQYVTPGAAKGMQGLPDLAILMLMLSAPPTMAMFAILPLLMGSYGQNMFDPEAEIPAIDDPDFPKQSRDFDPYDIEKPDYMKSNSSEAAD